MSGWAQAKKEAARHHGTMKAVLMNSAEKIDGVLSMKRTVLDTAGKSWKDSDARDDKTNEAGRAIPLAKDFGTGFLNASRAYEQLKGGQHAPFLTNVQANALPGAAPTPANAIGWDHNTINAGGAAGIYNKYRLPKLKGGDWVSATLTWDRHLTLQDASGNGIYDAAKGNEDDFKDPKLANLDLYLMKAGETDITKNVWSSVVGSPKFGPRDMVVPP
jgi:hypothetical protein